MPDDTTEEIQMKTGESTTVKLKGLATAGYQWSFVINGSTDLVTISKDFVLPEKNAGASADEVFTIKANKKGTADIYFVQKRNWEKNTNPANEKKIKIVIE